MGERFRDKYGDWRDEYIESLDWRRWIGEHVDPNMTDARLQDLAKPGGFMSPDNVRCTCNCHPGDHCTVCLAYWTPTATSEQVQRIGYSLKPRLNDPDFAWDVFYRLGRRLGTGVHRRSA